MKNIKLYHTGCPKCNVLIKKLKEANIHYEECTDVDEMLKKGFMQAPVLEVDGTIMNFAEANKFINEYKES